MTSLFKDSLKWLRQHAFATSWFRYDIIVGLAHVGRLGLLHDDAASLIGATISDYVGEFAQDIGGRLSPLIKLPLELASGQSLYHG